MTDCTDCRFATPCEGSISGERCSAYQPKDKQIDALYQPVKCICHGHDGSPYLREVNDKCPIHGEQERAKVLRELHEGK